MLFDDDPLYCSLLKKTAQKMEIDLDCFLSLEDMASIGQLSKYGAIVSDYDLGHFNGLEIAEYLSALFYRKPLLLISNEYRCDTENWPDSVQGFYHKNIGAEYILNALINVHRH